MASSIHAGLIAALAHAPQLDSVVLLTCDQPAVTGFHLLRLQMLAAAATVAASTYAGVTGVPAVFPHACFDELLALTGDSGARSILAAHASEVATLPLEHGELDLDTPESLAAIHRLWPA
jgi:CTP:molybdopterin cytidylyltransferase MocA